MKFEFSGALKVFSFTFSNQAKSKSFKALTIVISLILILIPSVSMPLIENSGEQSTEATGLLNTVYIADSASLSSVDFSLLNEFDNSGKRIEYVYCANGIDEAIPLAQDNDSSLILLLEAGSPVSAKIILPDNSKLNDEDLSEYGYFISSSINYLLLIESGAPIETVLGLMNSVNFKDTENENAGPEFTEEMAIKQFKEISSFVLPYLNIMILYFMILAYGQSVANSLVLEKSSKLMEFFLLSAKPGGIILGKITGIASCAVFQFFVWIASAVIGFGAGTFAVKQLNPNTDMTLIRIFDAIGEYADIFSLPGLLLGVIIIFAGFFLYCTIAAIGGAIAQKSEDLASTNTIFVLVLIISFIATLSPTGDNIMSHSIWHDFVPFTAILVTPSHLILGDTSIAVGILSLAIILLTIMIFAFAAGRLYKSMIFYKGNIPKPGQLIEFLKKK